MGYGVWVIYSDGFEEHISLPELHRLMGLLELQGLLLRIPERKEYNDPDRVMLQVKSAPRGPQVEKAGMVQVIGQRYFGERVEQTGAALDLLLGTTKENDNELEEFKRRFVGQKVTKWFQNLKGFGEKFSGEVNEVWRNEERYFARVVYEDGDAEDMSFEELERLINEGVTPNTHELQWPVFEVTEQDLVDLWAYHVASLQVDKSELSETNNAPSPVEDPGMLSELPPVYFRSNGQQSSTSSSEDRKQVNIDFATCTKIVYILISFAFTWSFIEQWFVGSNPPWFT